MKRLIKYKSSPIFQVRIKYGKELVSFNLSRELKIDEDTIDHQLTTQPTHYGFCLLLHKKLLTLFEEAKVDRKRVYGRKLLYAKENKQMNGRPFSDDAAKAWVESHKEFVAASMKCIKLKDQADVLFSCIKAFEQRKDLLQSISSNRRSEKF